MLVDNELKRSKKIANQVERWDIFAKVAPTFFLIVSFALLSVDLIDFDTVFYIGLVLFAITAVIWWWWTIISIRFLVHRLGRAGTGLIEVSNDLKSIRKEYADLKDNLEKKDNEN